MVFACEIQVLTVANAFRSIMYQIILFRIGERIGSCYSPSISSDDRYVAVDSGADNLVAGDNNNVSDVFVHDRLAPELCESDFDWDRDVDGFDLIAYMADPGGLPLVRKLHGRFWKNKLSLIV